MKGFISKQLIEFYKKTKFIIEQLNTHSNKENIDTNQKQQKGSVILTQFMDNIFFAKLKDIYLYPNK